MMLRAGRMRARCVFQTERREDDEGGGADVTWTDIASCRGDYLPERGREQMAAGRLEGSNLAVLRVRYSSILAPLTTTHRAVIDDVPHQIRSVIDPDRRRQMLELVVEKGVAPHG